MGLTRPLIRRKYFDRMIVAGPTFNLKHIILVAIGRYVLREEGCLPAVMSPVRFDGDTLGTLEDNLALL